jgi:hypothetical protein
MVQPAASTIAAAPRATSDPLYPKQKPRPIDEIANLTVAPTRGSGRSRRTGTLGAAGAAAISQATTHTVGGTQPIIRPKKKRVGAYKFKDSKEEDHNKFVEPNNNIIKNAKEGVTEEPGNKDDKPKTHRVTILPPVPETEEEANRVQYPKLRDFSASKYIFSSTRRVSTQRYKHATSDLKIVHRYEEEEVNSTKELVKYVVLYHANKDGTLTTKNIVAQVSDKHEFAKSVHNHPVL